MSGTLHEELASLKIDRGSARGASPRATPTVSVYRPKRDRGIGLISLLLWSIPLGLVGFGGYYGSRQYEQIRSKPEVTTGSVQSMTTGEAEKLLSAKGYLKSRYQAMIGAKIPGRVE